MKTNSKSKADVGWFGYYAVVAWASGGLHAEDPVLPPFEIYVVEWVDAPIYIWAVVWVIYYGYSSVRSSSSGNGFPNLSAVKRTTAIATDGPE